MSRAAASGVLIAACLALLGGWVGSAAAAPLPPEGLRVVGGEEAWHPSNGFNIWWKNPVQPGAPPIVAVHYRVRNPSGSIAIDERRIAWAAENIGYLRVPDYPGAYTFEVWLEDMTGSQGPAATTKLRFDNARPPEVAPLPRQGWIGRTEQPYMLRLGPLSGPAPVSGVRGYAISIDQSPSGDPCQLSDSCSEDETDLRGGIADNSLAIPELPEGIDYVHAVAVSGAGLKSATVGSTLLRVDKTDPVTHLDGVPNGWTNQSVALLASASDSLSGMAVTAGGDGPFTAISIDGGAPAVASGNSVRATVIASGAHTVAYYARDAAGNVNDGGSVNGRANHPPYTATVRIDRDPPQLAFLNAESPAAPETIAARVSDPLSGPAGAGGEIGIRRAGSDDRFEPLPTVGGEVLRAHWSSDDYPAGRYEFRAIAYDTAGNRAATTKRANGSDMVLSNPLKVPTAVTLGFAGTTLALHHCSGRSAARRCRSQPVTEFERRPQALTVPYGAGATISGRLVAGARAPLGQAEISIVESFDPGAPEAERVTKAQTNPDGSFTATLAPGPSREVKVVFAGSKQLARSASESARLDVLGRVRLRVSAPVARIGGRPVVFRGRVLQDRGLVPLKRRAVQLQFRIAGSPWSEFRTVQSDPQGHFRYAYRFSDDDSRGVRFQFRAFVEAQDGWPFAPAGSPPVAVLGR